jgi:hypothetical protein
MLTLYRPISRRAADAGKRSARPLVESLEQRDCPAAPTVTNFAARITAANAIVLTGNAHDDHQNTVILEISGGGSIGNQVALDVNNNGQFSITLTSVNTSATFFAEITDDQNVTSPQVQTVPSGTPTLTLACNQQDSQKVHVYGTVNDVNSANLTVSFSGIFSGNTTTDANGNYSFVASASALGNISATTTNRNNVTSNTAQATLTNVAPVIDNFMSSNVGTSWTFTGQVIDEWAMGLTVTLTTPGLQNPFTTTVGLDDTFSVTVTIPGFPVGRATAQTTDWWGVTSGLVYTPIRSGNS